MGGKIFMIVLVFNYNFKSIWYSECNDNTIRIRDLDFDNDGLTALLDINEDLRWGKENQLTEPRNALTRTYNFESQCGHDKSDLTNLNLFGMDLCLFKS